MPSGPGLVPVLADRGVSCRVAGTRSQLAEVWLTKSVTSPWQAGR
jgi:hypothetical protein